MGMSCMMAIMLLVMFLVGVLAVVGVIVLARRLLGELRSEKHKNTAQSVLQARFAHGEISREDFQRDMETLMNGIKDNKSDKGKGRGQ